MKVWAGTFSHLKLLGDLMEEMIGGKRSKRTHTDLGAKRLEKDSQHVKLISAWFSTHNPFIEVSIDLFHLLIVAQKSCHISVTICGTFTYHLCKIIFSFFISGRRPQHHYFTV